MPKTRGKLSLEDERKIIDNARILSFEEIAELVNRTPEFIKKVIIDKGLYVEPTSDDIVNRTRCLLILHSMPFWASITKELLPDEITFYEDNWLSLYKQLGEDMSYSEQVFAKSWITLEIQKHRVMKDELRSMLDIEALRKELAREYDRDKDDRDTQMIVHLEQQLSACEATKKQSIDSIDKLNKEIKYYSQKLKADREDRRDIKKNAQSWWGYLMELQHDEFREKQEYRAELNRIAQEKEKERLMGFHKYMDGQIDHPVLTHETITRQQEIDNGDRDKPDSEHNESV
jgi:hypothetical protein